MLVKNRMVKKLITIDRNCTVVEALSLMKKYSVRHLPVVDGHLFVGLITESDLREVMLPSLVRDIPVEQIMIENPITVGPNDSLEEAARIIYRDKIGGLPVLDKGKLVGILTTPDILAAFIELMGVLQSSSRLDLRLADRPKAFEEASGIIQKNGGQIISVGMMGKGQRKTHFFRLERAPLDPIIRALEKKGHRVLSSME
jgi:acetoin utilization protein AcuB